MARAASHGPPPVWLLALIVLSGTAAMHIFVPALPNAAQDLRASAAAVQMTISLYIFGLALGQLVYGPISDAFGRRPVLLAGLGLYTLAGAAAAFAPNAPVLIGARLLQALGGCAGLLLGRAIVRDSAATDDAMRSLATLNLMMLIGPGLAPLLGGAIAAVAGWRVIFVLLAAIGLLTVLLTWRRLPETGRPTGRISIVSVATDYRELLGSRSFVAFAIGGACSTTSFYALVAAAPFIFANELHRPVHEVGIYLAMAIIGMSAGNLLAGRLAGKQPIDRMIRGGNAVSVLSALVLLLTVTTGALTVPLLAASMCFYAVGVGLCGPAVLTRAITVEPRITGSAAGLYGFSQMLVGSLCTAAVTIGDSPALAAAAVLCVTGLISQSFFWSAANRRLGAA